MQPYRGVEDPSTGERYLPVETRGLEVLENPLLNKGTAFTMEEREALDFEGDLPPAVATMSQQLVRAYESYCRKKDDLEKFKDLMSLQDTNETLFYRLLLEHIEEMMPIVYTPTVGEACQKYSHIWRRPRGIYITAQDDQEAMERILSHLRSDDIAIMVVTDNEGILGLGDLGAGGMGIPVGKLSLYTTGAGIHPARCLPVSIDVGTNNAALLDDPLYLGVRRERLRGNAYFEVIDRFVKAVRKVQPTAVVQWEDFSRQNAFTILDRYREDLRSFNDDIQGTGGLVVAGILTSLRLRGGKVHENSIVVDGAGAAGVGISRHIVHAMMEEGCPRDQAVSKIWTLDSQGLVLSDRLGLQEYKREFARDPGDIEGWKIPDSGRMDLEVVVENVMPGILIGTSGRPGKFTEKVLRFMGDADDRPLIFPLSNPNSMSECHPQTALNVTGGRALIATGSPFPDVEYGGKHVPVAQGNNALIFPGVGLGTVAMKASRVTDGMFLAAGHALASTVSDARLKEGALYPSVKKFRQIARHVAIAVAHQAGKDGVAEEVSEEEATVRVDAQIWEPEYLPYRAV